MTTFTPGWWDLTYTQHFRVTEPHIRHEGTDEAYTVTLIEVHFRTVDRRFPTPRGWSVSFYTEQADGDRVKREVVAYDALGRATRAWVQPAVDAATAALAAMVAARKAGLR